MVDGESLIGWNIGKSLHFIIGPGDFNSVGLLALAKTYNHFVIYRRFVSTRCVMFIVLSVVSCFQFYFGAYTKRVFGVADTIHSDKIIPAFVLCIIFVDQRSIINIMN